MVEHAEIALVRSMAYLAESQSAIAHNLANVNTDGFKRTAPRAEAQSSFDALLGRNMPSVRYTQSTAWEQGTLRQTGERMHVAVEGNAFFRVQDTEGRRFYTREGHLHLDDAGYLTTAGGNRYLDAEGAPIQVGADASGADLSISPDGTITQDGRNRLLGRLGLVELPERETLHSIGGGLYSDSTGQPPERSLDSRVRQGFLEGSNVSSIDELVRMLEVQRTFQANQRVLGTFGRLHDRFVSTMSR